MLLPLAVPVCSGVALAHRYLQVHATTDLLVPTSSIRGAALAHGRRSARPRQGAAHRVHALAEAVAVGAPGWLNLPALFLGGDAVKVVALSENCLPRLLCHMLIQDLA